MVRSFCLVFAALFAAFLCGAQPLNGATTSRSRTTSVNPDSTTTKVLNTSSQQIQRRTQQNDDEQGSLFFGLFDSLFESRAFCPETNTDRYQTVRVGAPFAWIYQILLNRQRFEGECGLLCRETICKHQPCVSDFEAEDAERCFCFSESETYCGDNTLCELDEDDVYDLGTCLCEDGFEGDPIIGCTDIDECSLGDACGPKGECMNSDGSFTCDCDPGYFWDAPNGGCKNDNECESLGTSACGNNAKCQDTVGSFTCTCDPGYTGNPPNGGFCEDIDECDADTNPCGPNALECNNEGGGYSCVCKDGYEEDTNRFCSDINECSAMLDDCDDETEVCENTEGTEQGFQCSCAPGFTGLSPGCEDVDECSVDPLICGTNGICGNTIGSYECTCKPGFQGGEPPNCRKLHEYEFCPSGFDNDCMAGLVCRAASQTDETTVCCAETVRCNVSEDCCTGFYTLGQSCPSGLDEDCRGDLQCGKSLLGFGSLVCCLFAVEDLFSSTKNCVF